jgi:predicted ester cyclase
VNPDLKITFEEMLVDGDKTATRWILEGTNTGSAPDSPIAPTGRAFSVTGCSVMHHVNGKVVEEWVYSDMLGFYQQMGLVPSTEDIMAGNS